MTQETIIHTTKADEDSPVARIFNIQRYSLNDGNGIRTVIFLKVVRTVALGVLIRNQFHVELKRSGAKVNVSIVQHV